MTTAGPLFCTTCPPRFRYLRGEEERRVGRCWEHKNSVVDSTPEGGVSVGPLPPVLAPASPVDLVESWKDHRVALTAESEALLVVEEALRARRVAEHVLGAVWGLLKDVSSVQGIANARAGRAWPGNYPDEPPKLRDRVRLGMNHLSGRVAARGASVVWARAAYDAAEAACVSPRAAYDAAQQECDNLYQNILISLDALDALDAPDAPDTLGGPRSGW